MKKPRRSGAKLTRKRACRPAPEPNINDTRENGLRRWMAMTLGYGDDATRLLSAQYFVMSTSFVSGRKKKPTTRLMHAITIGYQRPE